MKRFLAIFLTLLVLCTLSYAAAEAASGITLEHDTLLVPLGEFKKIRYDASNALKNAGFTFEANDPDGIYVSYTGQVKGLKLGEYTVTITSVKDPSIVVVLPVQVIQPVETITIDVLETTLYIGQTTTLSYECLPSTASVREATFTSSKESVATIDDDGTITAVGRGSTNITVTSLDGGASGRIQITVQVLPTEVSFQQDEYAVTSGQSLKLKATVRPKEADNKELIWTSSDDSIISVGPTGSLKAKAPGTVTITAACKADPSVTASVTVQSVVPIKSIRFDTESYDLFAGDTLQLSPTFAPENATTTAAVYTSSSPNVCTVDKNGLVTAVGSGTAKITLTSMTNSNRKASVTIRVITPLKGVAPYQSHVVVGLNSHAFGRVRTEPLDASNKEIFWQSSDPSIAYPSKHGTRPRIVGLKWGTCVLTGTTAEGNYTVELTVHVGLPYEALAIDTVKRRGGQTIVTVRNLSNIHMTGVRFAVEGAGVSEVLPADIAPGAVSAEIAVPMTGDRIAIAGWESDTGIYNNKGELRPSFLSSDGFYEWRNGR